ncbi:uncharacterized protein LOC117167924 isoform X2 [Belonocnema kinseyi]|uniref:uncharacterized protein LOC117167924 isoform X2 n=1 Tax=Belonocnema kinseyi TaxID=2817044 RepID=UPI00143D8AFC|nr:uncharacterized protein LOC117167924 isoform X2 [Belonocnema kinseyi]
MAVVKTNIVSLVAVVIIVFSMTIHGFPDGNGSAALAKLIQKSNPEVKPEAGGDEKEKSVTETKATEEKAGDKPPANAESGKKSEVLIVETKVNPVKTTDKPAEKPVAKSDEKSANKSEKKAKPEVHLAEAKSIPVKTGDKPDDKPATKSNEKLAN